MDAVQRRVASEIYSMVIGAYGLPGHMRPQRPEDLCPECRGDGCEVCNFTGNPE